MPPPPPPCTHTYIHQKSVIFTFSPCLVEYLSSSSRYTVPHTKRQSVPKRYLTAQKPPPPPSLLLTLNDGTVHKVLSACARHITVRINLHQINIIIFLRVDRKISSSKWSEKGFEKSVRKQCGDTNKIESVFFSTQVISKPKKKSKTLKRIRNLKTYNNVIFENVFSHKARNTKHKTFSSQVFEL